MNDILPRVWIKAFWGFGPHDDGYIGFTRKADQERFIKQAVRGDLVLIYGAVSEETVVEKRRQVLGLLEVDPIPIRDVDAISPDGLARKTRTGTLDRWVHAVPVLRAWEIRTKIAIRAIAPVTYNARTARVTATQGELLTAEEAAAVFRLPVRQVPVFGQPNPAPMIEVPLEKVFRPSKGFTPSFGPRESNYEDGEHFLYVLSAEGDAGALLGRSQSVMHGKSLIKIGLSNDPIRRCEEHNRTLPPASVFKWKFHIQSQPYPDGASAKAAEDTLKDLLASKAESLGGEFFIGKLEDMQAQFYGVPGVSKTVIRAVR